MASKKAMSLQIRELEDEVRRLAGEQYQILRELVAANQMLADMSSEIPEGLR